MGLFGDVRHALTLRSVANRLRQAWSVGAFKTTLFGLCGAVLTAIVAHVTAACPGLIASLPTLVTAAFGAMLAYAWSKQKVASAGVTGFLAAGVAAVGQHLASVCGSDYVHQLPALAMAGFWVGLGAWLKSPHQS
jgi:FtsH-binding integral membrane protein